MNRAVAVVATVLAAGCGGDLFTETDGGAGTSNDGGSGDAATSEGGVVDGAAPQGCASAKLPLGAFCFDFDGVTDPSDGWSGYFNAAATTRTFLDSTTSTSPPQSLLVKSTSSGNAGLRLDGPASTHVIVSFDMKLEQDPESFEPIAVQWPSGNYEVLMLVQSVAGVRIVDRQLNTNPAGTTLTALTPAAFRSFTSIELDVDVGFAQIEVRANGNVVHKGVLAPASLSSVKASTTSVQLGRYTANVVNAHFDDVVIDRR